MATAGTTFSRSASLGLCTVDFCDQKCYLYFTLHALYTKLKLLRKNSTSTFSMQLSTETFLLSERGCNAEDWFRHLHLNVADCLTTAYDKTVATATEIHATHRSRMQGVATQPTPLKRKCPSQP